MTHQDPREMTATTIGKDLLSALVQELKLLPDTWPKLSQAKQDDIIDRLRDRVEYNIKMAVHLIASEGRTVVQGDLDQVTIKDGAKCVIKVGRGAESLHELYDSQGKAVLIVVADSQTHTGGMGAVRGESDQRAMDLGNEYTDDDGDGMDDQDDDDVVDAEFKDLPQLEAPEGPNKEELDQAWNDGYAAGAEGHPESACPVMDGRLCIQWVKGWKAYHEDNEHEDSGPIPTIDGELPNEHGVYEADPEQTIEWSRLKHSLIIEMVELANGKWLYAVDLNNINGGYSSNPLSLHTSADSRYEALRAVQSRLIEIYAKGSDSGLKGRAFEAFRQFVDGLVEPADAEA